MIVPKKDKYTPVKTSPYEIPPHLIEILKEHSTGFILLTVDHNGHLGYYVNVDNQVLMRGMLEELRDICSLNLESSFQDKARFFGVEPPLDSDDDEDDEK